MKLQDFISGTLKELVDGVKEAQPYVEKNGGAINPIGLLYLKDSAGVVQHLETSRIGQEVEFDLEVIVSEEKNKEGAGSISIPYTTIGIKGVILKKVQNRSVNRVKFKIPVIFPKGEYKEK